MPLVTVQMKEPLCHRLTDVRCRMSPVTSLTAAEREEEGERVTSSHRIRRVEYVEMSGEKKNK